MITINLEGDDRVQQFMAAIRGSAESRLVRKALGVEGKELIKQHLYEKDKTPNRLKGKRTHFYRQAGDATSYAVTSAGAIISVNKKGVRQRWKGGKIFPDNVQYLTIPLKAESHGKRARSFDDLFFQTRKGKKFLARNNGAGGLIFLYVLKKSVKQDPDPSVMPSDKAIAAMARNTVFTTVEGILKRRGDL